jgi:hypothetical protein
MEDRMTTLILDMAIAALLAGLFLHELGERRRRARARERMAMRLHVALLDKEGE